MTSTMLNRLTQLNSASPAKSRAYIAMEPPKDEDFKSSVPEVAPPVASNDYRFSVGKLPVWAKKSIVGSESSGASGENPDMPRGKWASRLGGQVTVKSHYDSDSVIPYPDKKNNNNNSDADIDDYSMNEDGGESTEQNEDGGESTEPEIREKTLFFQNGSESHGTFTVNDVNADELRKSQRRPRPSDLNVNVANPSQESDFEEDEDGGLSTPTAEKSMTSNLSVSSENVDRVGRRERFMKSNFESLCNNDDGSSKAATSISAMQRNAVTIAR